MKPIPYPEVHILSQDQAIERVFQNPGKYNVVSLWSGGGGKHGKEQPDFRGYCKNLLQLRFHDIDCDEKIAKHQGLIAPSDEHVKQILKFARTKQNESIIFHCYAGISRSSASAFVCLLDYFSSQSDNPDPIADALESLDQIKSWQLIRPNQRIVQLGIYNLAYNGGQAFEWFGKLYKNTLWEKMRIGPS